MEAEAFARAGTVLAGDAAHALFLGDDEGRPLFEGRPESLMLPEQPRPLGAPGLPAPPPAPLEIAPPALEVVPPAEAPPAQPVLQGVVVTPAPGAAYLGDGQGGPSIFLRPGESALGLPLERVYADHATFMGPEGEVDLPLLPQMPGVTESGSAPAPGDAAGEGAAATEGEVQP
jgi:FtsP/CotA-like multicopper oxidase with cupredoxin domain